MDKNLHEKDFFYIKTNEFDLVEFIEESELLHNVSGRRYYNCLRTEFNEEGNRRIYNISPGQMNFPEKESFYGTEITLGYVVVRNVKFIQFMEGWSVKSKILELTFQIFLKGKLYPEGIITLETEWFVDMKALSKMINLLNRYFKYGGSYDNLNFDIVSNYNKNTFTYGGKDDHEMAYLINAINDLDISYKSYFQSRPGKDDVTHYTMLIGNIPKNDFYFQNLLASYLRSKYHDKVDFDDNIIKVRAGHSYSYGSSADDRINDEKEQKIVKDIREMLIARFAIAYDSKDHLVHFLSKSKPDKWIEF